LDELAASTGRERSELAEEADEKYLDYERWAIGEVTEGLRQTDSGVFVSDEEMEALFNRYKDVGAPS
jgi:predicted transcriptional regulator